MAKRFFEERQLQNVSGFTINYAMTKNNVTWMKKN